MATAKPLYIIWVMGIPPSTCNDSVMLCCFAYIQSQCNDGDYSGIILSSHVGCAGTLPCGDGGPVLGVGV